MLSRVVYVTTREEHDGPAKVLVQTWGTPMSDSRFQTLFERVRTMPLGYKAALEKVRACDLVAYVNASGKVWHVRTVVGAYRDEHEEGRVVILGDPTTVNPRVRDGLIGSTSPYAHAPRVRVGYGHVDGNGHLVGEVTE